MQQTMTAEQATQFNGISLANYAYVKSQLSCECDPYADVFTYNRWKAQGRQVMKGEHGIRIPLVRSYSKTEPDGTEKHGKYMGTAVVFCRCQIEMI